MSGLAIILIISAAFVHALWNFLSKKAGGGVVFIWLFAFLSTVIYAPISVCILWITRPQIGWFGLSFIFVSALLHLLYFFVLQRGYSKGDLSLVYPMARGTGPMLSACAAIVFFLFGTLMGTHILAEGHSRRRIISACIMILGVIGLSLG